MTPKQILDSFSETLAQDDRILSAQERALVATLLHHANAATNENPETQEAVRAVIASAVGETVAQRAFAVLGGSIVERILETRPLPLDDSASVRSAEIFARTPGEPQPPHGPGPGVKAPPKAPQPPSSPMRTPGEPQPPSAGPGPGVKVPHKAPQPPGSPMRTPGEPQPPSAGPGPGVKSPQKSPQPPGSPMGTPGEPQPPHGPGPGVRVPLREPQPPHAVRTTVVSETSAAVADRPQILPARCVVLDEFLAPQELEALTRFTLESEGEFTASEVISPSEDAGIVNYEHRRSRVLMDLADFQELMLARIKGVLPNVLAQLDMEEFAIADVEFQITASNDGDFFHFHRDNGSDPVASRYLTFVYFFHRVPCQFEGGELRIHDGRLEDGAYVSEGSYRAFVPQQNQIVFFPSELLHEITPVNCPSQQFADSRFTLNGWLRR